MIQCHWPQSWRSDAAKPARPHCKLAWHGPWSTVHDWRGRSKPSCWMEGRITRCWLTTEADNHAVFFPLPCYVDGCCFCPRFESFLGIVYELRYQLACIVATGHSLNGSRVKKIVICQWPIFRRRYDVRQHRPHPILPTDRCALQNICIVLYCISRMMLLSDRISTTISDRVPRRTRAKLFGVTTPRWAGKFPLETRQRTLFQLLSWVWQRFDRLFIMSDPGWKRGTRP